MSSFTDPLDVRQLGGRFWQTLRTITYYTQCDDSMPEGTMLYDRCKQVFVIPEGFVTDFASIPSLAWPLIGHPAGEYAQAAVLHDYLYFSGVVTRAEADKIFVEAMKVLGVPVWKRWAMWLAVRAGGGLFYVDRP